MYNKHEPHHTHTPYSLGTISNHNPISNPIHSITSSISPHKTTNNYFSTDNTDPMNNSSFQGDPLNMAFIAYDETNPQNTSSSMHLEDISEIKMGSETSFSSSNSKMGNSFSEVTSVIRPRQVEEKD